MNGYGINVGKAIYNMPYTYSTFFPTQQNVALALAAYLNSDYQNLAEFHVCQVTGSHYLLFVVSETFLSKSLLLNLKRDINYFYSNVNYDAPFNLKNR